MNEAMRKLVLAKLDAKSNLADDLSRAAQEVGFKAAATGRLVTASVLAGFSAEGARTYSAYLAGKAK